MKGHLSGNLLSGRFLPGKFRRFARDGEGATMIEFAFIFPIVLMMTFGIMEISLCMASLVTLEGGLKQASRYGITSQAQGELTPEQKNLIPKAFDDPTNPRLQMIGVILNENTLDLIDLDDATPTLTVYSSFSVIKDGEPYNDLKDIPKVGDPPNGHYDGPGTSVTHPLGEPFSDMNCNGVRDGPGSAGSGAGAPGAIVVYTVNYNWRILTPIIGRWLGEPDPKHKGRFLIPMSASVVVKNEPQLSGSTFCGKKS